MEKEIKKIFALIEQIKDFEGLNLRDYLYIK